MADHYHHHYHDTERDLASFLKKGFPKEEYDAITTIIIATTTIIITIIIFISISFLS